MRQQDFVYCLKWKLQFWTQGSRIERVQRLVYRRTQLLALPLGHQLNGQPLCLLHQRFEVQARVLQLCHFDCRENRTKIFLSGRAFEIRESATPRLRHLPPDHPREGGRRRSSTKILFGARTDPLLSQQQGRVFDIEEFTTMNWITGINFAKNCLKKTNEYICKWTINNLSNLL